MAEAPNFRGGQPPSDLQKQAAVHAEKELRDRVESCMWGKWELCAAGVALGMPLSVKTKSYAFFLAGGVIGTAGDMYRAFTDCRPHREALDQFMRHKAQQGQA